MDPINNTVVRQTRCVYVDLCVHCKLDLNKMCFSLLQLEKEKETDGQIDRQSEREDE